MSFFENIKRYSLAALLPALVFMSTCLSAQSLVVNGLYQGKNLYVQNPFTGNMQDFCTNEVFVNDKKVMSGIKQSAFEINLSSLKLNEPVTIKITHSGDCKPRVLNPQVIKPASTFEFLSFSIDHDVLSWSTKGERPGGIFAVEQFVHNNWVTIDEMDGKASMTLNNYTIDESHHSGANKYRVKYTEKTGQVFYSRVQEHSSAKDPVTFYPKKAVTTIYLSREADYDVLDANGKSLFKGTGKEVNIQALPVGTYYLNIDNRTEKFQKK